MEFQFIYVIYAFGSLFLIAIIGSAVLRYNRRRAQEQELQNQAYVPAPAPPVVVGPGLPDAQVVSAAVVAVPAVAATAGANFCSGCGNPLSGPFCSNCGRKHGVASAEA
ncbi:unnamed protein product [Effrenium voratum]|uniref:Uncharacterized protein n=1 Tax=Effrenium voratum TaxID=2562239 RepID=A0AA36J2I2_9DINO|nr:unnamed protein product [Effrenium voratum]CAJ1450348.1 unnamed protein product [Effrenium voratum]